MNPLQMMGMIRDPNKFIQQMMNNGPMANNPIARNAFEMYQKGDTKGLNELANNLCAERGIDSQEAYKQIKSQLGM